MRVASNTVSEAMLRQIQQLTVDQAKLQTQVATGRRVLNPEDDAAAMGRVLNLQSEQRQLAQYVNNANRAMAISQASYSGLQSLKKVSDRAGELATLGASAIGPDAMKGYAAEVDQLIEQALELANGKLGNDYLFGGTETATAPFSVTRDADGAITGVTYDGNNDRASIPLSETSSVSPRTSGATNAGIADFITNLVALRDALKSGDTGAVAAAQSPLVASEDVIIEAMADTGGVQSRIEAAQAQQATRATNLESLISGEADIDLPSTVVKLSQASTAYQAALASAAKVMNLSLLDYIS
ncbi:MAG: flagellin [Opitutus sp.]|nr:flagellin [Opitutus sp.]